MGTSLERAAQTGDIISLYAIIQDDPQALDNIDAIQFAETPLHVAASVGHIRFATEIMRLKPSFAWKLNQQGFCPIHLALHNNRKTMVLRFVDMNGDLVRAKGREGLTPLHFVTQTGEIELLAEFLVACPHSIEDVTVRGETALHIAVKNQRSESLEVLMGWLQRTRHGYALQQEKSILNWKDDAGNTILHISSQQNYTQAVRMLMDTMIDLNAKNLEGSTALDLVQNQTGEIRGLLLSAGALNGSSLPPSPTLAEKLRSKLTLNEKIAISLIRSRRSISNDKRNALLVVLVLIATTTYQAALSPPGGISQSDNGSPVSNSTDSATEGNLGKSVMNTGSFIAFWFFNTTALLASTLKICFLLPGGRISISMFAPLYLFSYCYFWSMAVISPNFACFVVNLLLLFLLPILFTEGTRIYNKAAKELSGYGEVGESKSSFTTGQRW